VLLLQNRMDHDGVASRDRELRTGLPIMHGYAFLIKGKDTLVVSSEKGTLMHDNYC
jgi:hypothetical protein